MRSSGLTPPEVEDLYYLRDPTFGAGRASKVDFMNRDGYKLLEEISYVCKY